MLYHGHLQHKTFSPFIGSTNCIIDTFLKRMENGGWLIQDINPAFYRLTPKSLSWKKENRDKTPSWYDKEQLKKYKEKSKP